MAFSHANTNEETTTPANTAIAISKITVKPVTNTITITSDFGTLLNTLNVLQAKVPITTINMTPTKAAMGTCSIRFEPNKINTSKATEATIPESLPLPPDLILMIL